MNINIKIFKTVILLVVLCGCENWSLTFSEERTIRVFENRVLRRIFRFKKDEVKRSGENYMMWSLISVFLSTIFWVLKSRRYDRCMLRVWGEEMGIHEFGEEICGKGSFGKPGPR